MSKVACWADGLQSRPPDGGRLPHQVVVPWPYAQLLFSLLVQHQQVALLTVPSPPAQAPNARVEREPLPERPAAVRPRAELPPVASPPGAPPPDARPLREPPPDEL